MEKYLNEERFQKKQNYFNIRNYDRWWINLYWNQKTK